MNSTPLPKKNDLDKLTKLISNRQTRNKLIGLLLPINPELSVKVRFVSAVEEYDKLKDDTVDKKQKGRKIVVTFLESGSLYNLKNIPETLQNDLIKKQTTFASLLPLQMVILLELSTDETVLEVMEQMAAPPTSNINSKRPPQLDLFSAEFYDTVISPLPSPLFDGKSEQVQLLETVMENKIFRHRLIMRMAKLDLQMSVKVRLCCSLLEFWKISEQDFPAERKAKGRKIVAAFVHSGSLFCVKGIPASISEPLVEEKFDMFKELQKFLYADMMKDAQLKEEVRLILTSGAQDQIADMLKQAALQEQMLNQTNKVARWRNGGYFSEFSGRQDSPDWSAKSLLDPSFHAHIVNLHRDYLQNGADWITTCNFSVRSFNGFSNEEITHACEIASRLAREAVHTSSNVKVIGSLPPLGECFRCYTSTSFDEYKVMLAGLREHCDEFLAETLGSVAEAFGVCRVMQDENKPYMIAFTVTSAGTLCSGETASLAVSKVLSFQGRGPRAILFNCAPPESIECALRDVFADSEAVRLIRQTRCELGVYPNRYVGWDTIGTHHRTEWDPTSFVKFALDVMERYQVTIVGGCCGITPEYIAALRKAVSESRFEIYVV